MGKMLFCPQKYSIWKISFCKNEMILGQNKLFTEMFVYLFFD